MPRQPNSERSLESLELDELARVSGGQNTDFKETRLMFPRVNGVPIPTQVTKQRSTRSELGQCIDDSNASCQRQGGTNESIGACMLKGIDACDKRAGQ